MSLKRYSIETKGHGDFVDITDRLVEATGLSGVKDGVLCAFVPHSTAALTMMENEEGLMNDLRRLFEAWAPEAGDYEHHKKWNDKNGAAHVKSAVIGSDLCLPIENGMLQNGPWQQAVLIDFDEKPRTRELLVQIIKA